MPQLHGKVTVVTGGANGIGAAIARRLSVEGATVVITDIQCEAGEALANQLNCTFLRQDVTSEEEWAATIREIEARYGSLNALVNNAGIEGPFDAANPENTRLSDWQRIQRVNVEGVFLGCRAAIPLMRNSGGGAIINMSSTAALVATPDFLAYGASKAAVQHLSQSIALHCGRNGSKIRCNSVHPGTVMTPMMERIIQDTAARRGISVQQMTDEMRVAIPQGEFQLPEDVASAVSFLASDEAKHITGIGLVVDGGITLKIASAVSARPHAR